jgi:hypothetical protein
MITGADLFSPAFSNSFFVYSPEMVNDEIMMVLSSENIIHKIKRL